MASDLKPIDYQYWADFWESYPSMENKDYNGTDLRPSDYDHHKALAELQTIVKLNKKMKVLDVGGGTGKLAALVAPKVKHITVIDRSKKMFDISTECLKGIKNVTTLQMDAIDLKFDKNSFDLVYSFGVIQYVHRDFLQKLISDQLFVVKPRGTVIIGDIVPVDEKYNPANVTQIPKEYWDQYGGKIVNAIYEDRYHAVLRKGK